MANIVLGDIVSSTEILLDEDDMASDSATQGATQQSIKKYHDDNAGGGLWEEDGANVKLSSAKHIDAQNFQMITAVCHNGATIPATVTPGQSPNAQWFYHTPTGRSILMQFRTMSTGTADTDTASKLVDSGATFSTDGVMVGCYAYDTTNGDSAVVTAVDSETSLSLDSDAFAAGTENYDVGCWVPIYAYGAMTVYVDSTDGGDKPNLGTAVDGSAFKTIQYTIDQTPPLFSGNVTINVNAEAYAEDVVIGGKTPTGDYVVKLVGILVANDAGLTAEAASVQGTGATQGTVVDTDQINNAVANELVCLDPGGGNEQYRIIDSITGNDTITICGTWSVDPDGETFTTYEWGTEIQSITAAGGQKVIEVYDVKFPNTGSLTDPTFGFSISAFIEWFGSITFYRCYFPQAEGSSLGYKIAAYFCSLITYQCSFVASAEGNFLYGGEMANVTLNGTKFDGAGNSTLAIRPSNIANFRLNRGTVVDNCDFANGALYASLNCVVNCKSLAADGYNRIRNSTIGIKANFGSQVKNTSNVQYSGNGTNESADAATFAYID